MYNEAVIICKMKLGNFPSEKNKEGEQTIGCAGWRCAAHEKAASLWRKELYNKTDWHGFSHTMQ
jgi:hypothetical protein